MTEPSMIERVAKAIYDCHKTIVPTTAVWEELTEPYQTEAWFKYARAAIKAMYQPNDYMVESAFDGPTFRSASKTEIANCWRLMVCAALKETTP